MNHQPSIALAARMTGIEPFQVMEIQNRAFELEAQGRTIVHMEIGQPDFPAPPQVIEAAVAAVRGRALGYTPALGIPELREAIAGFYRQRHGLEVSPDRIVVTAGASGAFLLALGALVEPDDEWLMPDPCYPCNRHFVRLFEGRARALPVDERQSYQLSADEVRDNWTERTRGVMIASPANPTGTTIAANELGTIIEFVRWKRGFAVVDEIYLGLTYDCAPSSALALAEDIFVVNSFSKYFNMTGWRLGWMVAPAAFVREIERLAQNVYICPPAPAQYAALAAFGTDTLALLEERRLDFMRRRDFLLPALRSLGFRIPVTPSGAFYIYAGCERFAQDSSEFALRLLEKAGVAVTPGSDFGKHRARTHVRFAYTRSLEELEKGVARIDRLL